MEDGKSTFEGLGDLVFFGGGVNFHYSQSYGLLREKGNERVSVLIYSGSKFKIGLVCVRR